MPTLERGRGKECKTIYHKERQKRDTTLEIIGNLPIMICEH